MEKRGAFYDRTGALRDMVQNHALQLLSLIAMEPPINARRRRDPRREAEGAALAEAAGRRKRRAATWCAASTRAGTVGGEPVPGYREEPGAARQQHRNLRRAAHRDRRTGAGPACPSTSAPASAWPRATRTSWSTSGRRRTPIFQAPRTRPNKLVINLQPEDGLELHLLRGQGHRRRREALAPVLLDLDFDKRFADERVGAYERLLLDVIAGRLNLFVRSDEQEEAWRWVEPILELAPRRPPGRGRTPPAPGGRRRPAR